MLLGVDARPLSLGIPAPQHEDQTRPLAAIKRLHNSVGKAFPAATLMRVGLGRNDGEDCVEHQNALIGPLFQTAALRPDKPRYVIYQFAKHVLQGWGRVYAVRDRKTHAMGLIRGVVRILAEDDNAGPVEGGVIKGGEDVFCRREDSAEGALCSNEVGQGDPERLV